MRPGSVSLRALLERPVVVNGIRLGVPGDAVLDGESLRVVGLEIACTDGRSRFLPLAAARIREDHVAVGSALILLEEDARSFYQRRSCLFASLLGAPVAREGSHVGTLADLVIAPDGTVEEVITAASGAETRSHAPGEVTLGVTRRVSAA